MIDEIWGSFERVRGRSSLLPVSDKPCGPGAKFKRCIRGELYDTYCERVGDYVEVVPLKRSFRVFADSVLEDVVDDMENPSKRKRQRVTRFIARLEEASHWAIESLCSPSDSDRD